MSLNYNDVPHATGRKGSEKTTVSNSSEETSVDSQQPGWSAPTLRRNIGALAIIGLGLSICNGWAAMSSTVVIGLGQGGTPVVLYGLIGTSFINIFLALTLSELSAAYPTAGGQYVWSSILAGPKTRRGVSFMVGWATIFEWVTIVASVVIISAEVVYGLVTTYHPHFEVERWHVFLIFMVVNTISTFNNLFVLTRLPNIGTFFLVFSSMVYFLILITVPAKAPSFQSNEFVWNGYRNDIGWKNKLVVISKGLVNPSYVFAGLDGAVHIAEDCLDPARTVPYSLLATVACGLFTGFTFSIALLYSIQDVEAAADAELPFLTIIVQATSSKAAGAVFMTLFLMVLIISSNSVHHASSRLIWSFARDKGLPCADKLARVHPTLRVPVIPILLSWFGVTLLGVLYIASRTVYSSIIACCIILGNFSYAVLAIQLMLRKRQIEPGRWLKLGWFGWVANILTVLWFLFTTVMWLFPSTPNPKGSEMNYSVAVLGAMAILAYIDWLCYGSKHFVGPSEVLVAPVTRAISGDVEPGTRPPRRPSHWWRSPAERFDVGTQKMVTLARKSFSMGTKSP